MEKSIGGSGKEYSKLCLAGFILTIMPVLLLPLCLIFPREYGVVAALAIILLMPLTGLIVSIVGLITAGRKGKTGKGFGIAGVVLPSLVMTAIAIILIPVFGFFIGASSSAGKLAKNEMYPLGYMVEPKNTEYDVSKYRIPGDYVFYSNDISVSESEFEEYAESKLQTIENTTDMSIRGVYQDYNFLIIRSDKRDAWLESNSPDGFKYYDGYASISYPRQGMEWMIIPETLAVYLDPSDKFIIITNCNDYKVIAEFFEGIGEAVPTEATTEETTETQAPNPPEFYDEYESVVYLRENINEDMSLLDIINVFDESCKYTRDEDMDMFNLEFGTFNYYTYDHYADEHVDLGKYYCFCMERWFTAEDGHDYIIYVSVLYEVNDTNKDYKHVRMTDIDIPKGCSDFFDYLRKSYAYDYASKEDIAGVDIYMIDMDSYQEY
ncbi:MAG: DUF4190 domain-containing protein [Clostridiales bacterium]|nr:DUF4190 domain-containing protein [Clostridiales bacterium]